MRSGNDEEWFDGADGRGAKEQSVRTHGPRTQHKAEQVALWNLSAA